MAKREVAFPGFSGLLAFGAGVAVGANWPRASNFVGFILQRLGFELTDLALWMWDPEKSMARDAEITPVKRAKAKRAQALAIHHGAPNSKRVGAKGKAKPSLSAGIHQSREAVHRRPRRKANDGGEPWIRSEELNGSRANRNSSLITSSKVGSRSSRRRPAAAAGKKAERATVKAKRKTSSSGHGRKISTFPDTILPAEAALN